MTALHFVDSGHSLNDRVSHALARHRHLVGRCVQHVIDNQNVVLIGRVQTYFQKQMAQETLRHVVGMHRIVNDLEVVGA